MNLSLGNIQQIPLNLLAKVQQILKQRLDEVNKVLSLFPLILAPYKPGPLLLPSSILS